MTDHRRPHTMRRQRHPRPMRWVLAASILVSCTAVSGLTLRSEAAPAARSIHCVEDAGAGLCDHLERLPLSAAEPLAASVPAVRAAPRKSKASAAAPAESRAQTRAQGKVKAQSPVPPQSPVQAAPPGAPPVEGAPSAPVEAAVDVSPVPPAATAPGVAGLEADSGRPFAPDSAWNTLIPADPAIDPESAAMVAAITPNGRAYANLYEFGDPVFTADASTPTATVDCTMPWGDCPVEGRALRIPAEARPTAGSDGRLIVVDLVDRTSCDFWQARRVDATRWTTSWATCASLDGDGRGPDGVMGATGAGVNALTGVVRTFEMRNLGIPHALSVATNNSCRDEFRYPAKKTDGHSTRADCIPEGARLQLDPSIDVAAIPGITPGEVAVARALQQYGGINRDNSGAPLSISFETPIGEPDPYPAAGFPWDFYDMPHIPWDRLRVLGSWDGS